MELVALPGGSATDPVFCGAQAFEDFEQEIVDQYASAETADTAQADTPLRGQSQMILRIPLRGHL
jgi:hypothetical protein